MDFVKVPNFIPSSTQNIASRNNPSIPSPNYFLSKAGSTNPTPPSPPKQTSRYVNQKRRDWNTFCQYIRSHRPPLPLTHFNATHVLGFLQYLDQFGKTKVHNQTCPYFGMQIPPGACPCPLRQAWGSLDALIGRLRAAYEENGGRPETNPFGARTIRIFLREVRDFQSKARGISYDKKRKRHDRIKGTNNIVASNS